MLLKKLVNNYLEQKQFKALSVEESKGMCDYYSTGLYKYLKENGLPAEVIEGIGYTPTLDESAHVDWKAFKGKDQQFLAHVVVKVDNEIVDLTGAQFNARNKARIFYPYSTFKREWQQIKTPKSLNK